MRSIDDKGRAYSAASIATLVIGGAVCLTGALLFISPRKPKQQAKLELRF